MAATAAAAVVPDRLQAGARLTERAPLPQGVSKRLATSTALGALDGSTKIESMSLVLVPSAAQDAALSQLLADQQNPASANYHKWLTPAQFGQQFGVSDNDLQVLENWLTSQGLQVQTVAASRNQITFSGTAATVQTAFGTSLSRFQRNGQTFFDATTAPTMPAAFTGIVGGVQGLSSYRLQPRNVHRSLTPEEVKARQNPDVTATTTSGTAVHLLAPYDLRQIYGANSLVSSGFTGTGITIAVIGQSAINTTQLADFQTLTGQPVAAPTQTLVPGTGASTVFAGDEGESESDLEFSGGVAPGATINFVYTGNGSGATVSPGVITALEYAIVNNTAPIVTLSYGSCEVFSETGSQSISTVEPFLRQANAQGQTVLNSSGDSGSASCDGDSQTTTYDGAQVSYPASSAYVTGVGGTTFSEGTGNYWSATNNSQLGSALSYIPEVVWNDTAPANGLASSGGGASILFSKPNWQTGTGVPADGARDVPDVSFAASPVHDPYIVCTADTSFSGTSTTGQPVTGNCTTTALGAFVIGGTSLSTPTFAGMLALVEQANGGARLGNINATLYALAAQNRGVFNDVTVGNNQQPCIAGTTGCVNGLVGFSAGTGYDQATGLGSVNVSTLSTAVTAATAVTARTPTLTVTLASSSTTTAVFSINVASPTSATVPTGTVNVSVDGGTATSLSLTSGSTAFSLTLTGLSTGTHTITAVYSGDSNYSTATGSATINTSGTTGSFTLTSSPGTLTVVSGTKGTATLSLVSTGYTGLVLYTISPATGSSLAPGCFIGGNGDLAYGSSNLVLDTSITSGTTVSAGFTYDSLVSDCTALAAGNIVPSRKAMFSAGLPAGDPHTGTGVPWEAFAFGGFALGGLALRRRKALAGLGGGLLVMAFTMAVLGATGCGNGSAPLSTTTTTTPTGAKGTFNYIITATSYPAGTVVGSANFTVVVQ